MELPAPLAAGPGRRRLLLLGGPDEAGPRPEPEREAEPEAGGGGPLVVLLGEAPGGPDAGGPGAADLRLRLRRRPPAYRCPEPQCALAFGRRQQLRVHLLTHGGRRPFACPRDGCGWAFATAYKLRRHLQAHGRLRPFGCPAAGCGKAFTTVYNLRAHMRGHARESAFACEECAARFPTRARLGAHRRSHFEPERPYKCDFPGCEKTFITVSALFSHSRAHFREQELFSCSFPGCSKQYDKACRLKIHLRSHTGERPFVCDSDSCGWTFTSMSKLLRHKRKHDDDRRFPCPVEGCGKSFTRAEHLKGHSITHLGTKPFECPVEGCRARFSARSSLYIHSKKHLQDAGAPKRRSPLFPSKHSAKTARQHGRRQELAPQLDAPSSLTPSSELSSPGRSELANLDLAALFSDAPAHGAASAGDSDEPLSSDILTIDVASVGSSLGGGGPANSGSLGPMDPLVLVAHGDIPPSLDSPLVLGTAATVLPPGSFGADEVQAMGSGALGCLVALPVKDLGQDPPALSSSSDLAHSPAPTSSGASQETASVPDLAPIKMEQDSPDPGARQSRSCGPPHTVLCGPAELPEDAELGAGTGGLYLDSGGSARTDYRAIQLAKAKKQRGAGSCAGASETTQEKVRGGKPGPPGLHAGPGTGLCKNLPVPSRGPPGPAPVVGVPCVQVPVLQPSAPRLCKLLPLLGLTHQDEPSGEGALPLALSPQPSACHPCFTVDLPVYVLQEVLPAPGAARPGAQAPGSTINLRDLQ